jgi:superfamily II DNA helicase RecQ
MTLGEVSIDPETDTVYFANDMKSTKYDTLLAYIEEHPGEPMLIFTDSAKFAHVVAYRLIQDGHKALPWAGDVDEDVRHALKDAFVAGEIDFIVATIASIGEGVDGLQHRARTMVWLSRSDNNMLNMQAFRRLYRRGQEKQVVSIDIVARNTYDSGQLNHLIEQALQMNRSLKLAGK